MGELLPTCYGSLGRPDIMRVTQEGIPMGLLCLSGCGEALPSAPEVIESVAGGVWGAKA